MVFPVCVWTLSTNNIFKKTAVLRNGGEQSPHAGHPANPVRGNPTVRILRYIHRVHQSDEILIFSQGNELA